MRRDMRQAADAGEYCDLKNPRAPSFSQDQERVAVSFKLRKKNRIRSDNANGGATGIVASLEQYDFRRRAVGIGHGDEISIGGDDGKAVLLCVVPYFAVSCAAGQADLRDVSRVRKEIQSCIFQPAGKVFIEE